jgi:hypothetical protein
MMYWLALAAAALLLRGVAAQVMYNVIDIGNYTDWVNCHNLDIPTCAYTKTTVLQQITNCHNTGNYATMNFNNDVLCQCCYTAPTVPPIPTTSVVLNSTTVQQAIDCTGYTSDQCSQLMAQSYTKALLCENEGAQVILSTIYWTVDCYFNITKDAKQTFFGSVIATSFGSLYTAPPDFNSPVIPIITPYLVPILAQTVAYWLDLLPLTNAVPTLVPFGSTVGYITSVQNGCGDIGGTAGPCSFQGTCNVGYSSSYCICNPGYSGIHCEHVTYEQPACDCGVTWTYTSLSAIQRVSGYTLEFADAAHPGFFPVFHFDQAKYECYNLATCDGFVWSTTATGFTVALIGYQKCMNNNTAIFTDYPGFSRSPNCNLALGDTVDMKQVFVNLGINTAQGAFMISRTSGYDCSDYVTTAIDGHTAVSVRGTFFDAGWYYFSNPERRHEIDMYSCAPQDIITRYSSNGDFQYCSTGYWDDFTCPNAPWSCQISGFANDGKYDMTVIDAVAQKPLYFSIMYYQNGTNTKHLNVWVKNAWKHWSEIGHKQRYGPNGNCHLAPTLYDPTVLCSAPTDGCWYFTSGGAPCGAPYNGYCAKDIGATVGYCSCNAFGPEFGAIQGNTRFYGIACQSDAYYTSVTQQFGVPLICSGVGHVLGQPSSPPYQVATPSWYLPAPEALYVQVPNSIAACNCDGSGYGGQFCQTNQCGTCGSSSAQGICNSVTINNITIWKCRCQGAYIGKNCQIFASNLIYPPNDINGKLCSGAGQALCYHVNSDQTTTFDVDCIIYQNYKCVCNDGYYGQYCEQQTCAPNVLTPGHGVCNTNDGSAGSCYPPYSGSAYVDSVTGTHYGACWQDNCALWGGQVTGIGWNSTCSCPYGTITYVDSGGKTSCRPNCDFYQGVRCGPDYNFASCVNDAELPAPGGGCAGYAATGYNCIYSATLNKIRTARCSCTGQYPLQRSPSNTTQYVCLKRCKNGGTYSALGDSCQCAGTGFEGLNCDNTMCHNNGTYNSLTGTCSCSPPWGGDYCDQSLCGDVYGYYANGTGIPYSVAFPSLAVKGSTFYGPNGWQCKCNMPFTGMNSTQPVDCQNPIGVCGAKGRINPAAQNAGYIPSYNWCQCNVLYYTNQTKFSPTSSQSLWSWCDISECLNGGTDDPVNRAICSCPVPYYAQRIGTNPQPFCTLHTCGVHGKPYSGVGCVCDVSATGVAFYGKNCTTNPCRNGGTWNVNGDCICGLGWQGIACEVAIPCVQGFFNASNMCQCLSGWAGPYCDVSKALVIPTPAPTTMVPTIPPFTIRPPGPSPAPGPTPTPAPTPPPTSSPTPLSIPIYGSTSQFSTVAIAMTAVSGVAVIGLLFAYRNSIYAGYQLLIPTE